MKLLATLMTLAAVSADCVCLGDESENFPGPSLFNTKNKPADYGATCKPWDIEDESCLEGGANAALEWCKNDWCYVAAENTCETGVYDTVFFADDAEWAGKLKFSTKACIPVVEETAADAEGSSALFASIIAVSAAALAASI